RIAGAAVAVVALAILAVVLTWPLGARAALSMLVAPMGYVASTGHLSVSATHANIQQFVLRTREGEPVLSADRLDVRYNLRDLLPGSRRLYGLVSLRLDRPRLSVLHRRDGTWNIPLPQQGGNPAHPAPPFNADVAIVGGTVDIVDLTRHYADARHFRLESLNVDAHLHPHVPSRYDVSAVFVEPGGRFPLKGAAKFNEERGYERQHWTAARLAAAPIVNYVVDAPALHALGGELDAVDVLAVGLADAKGEMDRRLFAGARLVRGRLQLAGVGRPIDDLRGRFHATEQTLVTQHLAGTLAAVPLEIAGGLFDITQPKLRLGVRAAGPLPALLKVSPAAEQLPLQGRVGVRLLVESDARRPLTIGAFSSDRVAYSNVPVNDISGRVAVFGNDATVLEARGSYGAVDVRAQGNVTLGQQPLPVLVASVDAPPRTLPYLAQLAPALPLRATTLLTGTQRLDGRGIVSGSSPDAALAATFDVDRNGRGRVGPLTLNFADGRSLYARAQLDRPHDRTDVALVTHRLVVHDTSAPPLPGLNLSPIPAIDGRLDAAMSAEIALRGPVWVSGRADAAGLRIAGTEIDEAHLVALGGANDVGISQLSARGPWGRFDGNGSQSSSDLAIAGRFQGDLGAVGAVVGRRDLSGNADVPLRVLRTPDRIVAQVEGARLSGVSLNGIQVAGLSGTVGVRGSNVDVYAATAQAAGGHVVAAGSIGRAANLGVSLGDVPVSAIPGGGALHGGTVTAIASVSGDTSSPEVNGGVALQGASLRGLPLDATTNLSFGGGRLLLRDATAIAGGIVANGDGTVSGIGAAAPRLNLHASADGVDLRNVQRVAGIRSTVPFEGSVDADVAVRGTGAQPVVNGRLIRGSGSVNGLAFFDLGADVSASRSSAVVRSGGVTVGSTRVGVSGAVAPELRRVRIVAPHANLADFNDYFDPADTLGGRGSLDVALTQSNAGLSTRGHVEIANARYRRFALGTTSAAWHTRGRQIQANANVRGDAGTLTLAASALLPAHDPLRDPLDRVPLDVRTTARDFNLSTWLPAAGMYAPIVGFVDAQAEVHGVPRTAAARGSVAVRDAFVYKIPLQRASLAAEAHRGRVSLSQAVVSLPNLSVTANGSFGLRPIDPLDVRAVVTSPDIGALTQTLSGKKLDAAGELSAQLHLTGTPRTPRIENTVDLTDARYAKLAVRRVHAALALDDRWAALDDAVVDFNHGTVRANLHAPFDLRHPGLRANAPISGGLQLVRLDLADFGPLLSNDTTLKGLLDGQIRITGTTHAPQTTGTLALNGGYYASSLLRSPVENMRATLALHNETARLSDVHANIGRGSIDGNAVASIADLHDPARTLVFRGAAVAKNVQIDAPKYIRGTIDGGLNLSRAGGGPVQVAGNIVIPSARVPLSALYNPAPSKAPAQAPPPIGFDLDVTAGNDVRVQSGQVDVGGQGSVHVGGTLAAPTLAGVIRATGGSVDFYRSFQLQRGTVRFNPQNGIMPTVYAEATTRVPEPETYVTLTVSGLAPDALNVQLASDPYYDRSQILGLLLGAQQLGAVNGLPTYSSTAPNAAEIAQSFAETALTQQFTRQILEPLSAQVGRGLGLNQFAINYDPYGGFGTSARKSLGQRIDAVWAQTFSYPSRQSFGIEAHPRPGTAVQLTFFQQQGTGRFDPQIYATSTNPALTASQPTGGTSGWTFVLQKRFWGGKVKPKPSPAPATTAATSPSP
ncbi:MAG: translocation/assembly module TamB domain-containing protein, partial [Candidatus Eremiobacteraeota bacterium]|nr:translocation/assembly module TamB domain-containing protein [Candidatus Eremiobacteraeota bacterium]